MKNKLILPLLLYLLINSLFVLKYGSRLESVNEYILTLLYIIVVLIGIFYFLKISINQRYYKFLFRAVSIIFFAFTVFLNVSVDGEYLNVDRWSAMEAGIKALLQGHYPYSAVDHMGGRTSNLPSLIFLGIPFYLLGDVGYLQSFSFLLFCLVLLTGVKEYRERLLGLLLLILSPSYLWEIYVKSDLMSNFILVLLFLIIIQNRVERKEKSNIIILSFCSTALILTRLTALIPVSLLVFKIFWNLTLKEKVSFIVVGLFTLIILLIICFYNAGSLENFRLFNPFELQNRYLPFSLSALIILFSLLYSFRVKDMSSLMKSGTLLLLLPVLLSFLISISRNGIFPSIFNSAFDISYFNIVMPFLLMVIVSETAKAKYVTD